MGTVYRVIAGLSCLAGFAGLFWMVMRILSIGLDLNVGHWDDEVMLAFFLTAAGVYLLAAPFWLVWLYQAWARVPARGRDTTPGLAVGLLFVPLFNFYWVFRAVRARKEISYLIRRVECRDFEGQIV